MIVRMESPAVVSTGRTTTAGGTSTGRCGFGRVCAPIAGTNASVATSPSTTRWGEIFMRNFNLFIQVCNTPGRGPRFHDEVETYKAKAAEGLPAASAPIKIIFLGLQVELEWHLNELLHLLATDLRR